MIGAGAAGIAAARRIMAANRKVIVVEASNQIGGRCQTDVSTFDVPFDRGARWMHNPETNPMIKLARSAGLEITTAPQGQKIRIGRRNARAGETEEFLAALVRANRAIDDAARRFDVSCASVLPKDLGVWADTAEFVLGANFSGKDLKDISVGDKARAQDRNTAIACRQGLGALIAKLGEQVPVSLSTPANRIVWGSRDVSVETSAGKILARAAVITVSSNVLAAGNIKFASDIPEAHARCGFEAEPGQLRSDRAADAGQSARPRARRHRHRTEQFDEDGADLRQYRWFVAVFDRRRRLVRPRSLRPGRSRHGRVCEGMADEAVRQRSRSRREEIERDTLERRAVCARRDVGSQPRRTIVAKGFERADRLHVSSPARRPTKRCGERSTAPGRAASALPKPLCAESAR